MDEAKLQGCTDGACAISWGPAADVRSDGPVEAYEAAVAGFIPVDALAAEKAMAAGQDVYLYIGRPTCRWCRRMIPLFAEVAGGRGVEVLYLDSTSTQDDEELAAFRDRHGVKTVPTVFHSDAAGKIDRLEVDLETDDATLRTALEEAFDTGFAHAG